MSVCLLTSYLRAGFGAVHDGVTAVQREGVLELGEPLLGVFVTRVDHPAVRLKYTTLLRRPVTQTSTYATSEIRRSVCV